MKIQSQFGPKQQTFEIGEIVFLAQEKPLKLSVGAEIKNFPIAFQTYGKLNADKSNAILICHALTGDQYVASKNPITQKDGWWDFMIGAEKPIDTNKFFVICSNIIGGCMGSWGPKSINPETEKTFASSFPLVTIQDMVHAQNLLIEHFGIGKLHAIIGGSTGGMQALAWGSLYPQKSQRIIAMATSYRHSPQNIAFHEVGRQAIISDNNWQNGEYLENSKFPTSGLALARMTAHITYLSESALQKKFGRDLKNKDGFAFSFDREFQVENYLHHQGSRFVERFDPNSYLYITRAVDYFDLESDFNGNLSLAFADFAKFKNNKICIISFSHDWLFPPSESKKLTKSMLASGANVSSITINSNAGHDAFLLDDECLKQTINSFISN